MVLYFEPTSLSRRLKKARVKKSRAKITYLETIILKRASKEVNSSLDPAEASALKSCSSMRQVLIICGVSSFFNLTFNNRIWISHIKIE